LISTTEKLTQLPDPPNLSGQAYLHVVEDEEERFRGEALKELEGVCMVGR